MLEKIKHLIKKILRISETNKYMDKILKEIIKNAEKHNDLFTSIKNIYLLIKDSKFFEIRKNITSNYQRVANNLVKIIDAYYPNNNIKIVDIGGGEGNVVYEIAKNKKILLNDVYCVENTETWSEEYKFKNDIRYVFWDNKHMDIEDNSVDVIIIMVVLHHMSDEIIKSVFTNIKRILKPGGIVILKEHYLTNTKSEFLIDWEHHLYTILHIPKQNYKEFINNYLSIYVKNYKNMSFFNKLFKLNGMQLEHIYNTAFIETNKIDKTNVTNLYWAVFRKIV